MNNERKHTYTIREHGDGKTWDIIVHEPESNSGTGIKKEIDTQKLLDEARSLTEYNKRFREQVTSVPKNEKPEQQKQVTVKQFQDAIDDAKIMASVNKRKQISYADNIFDY
jgi:hypothetical protein